MGYHAPDGAATVPGGLLGCRLLRLVRRSGWTNVSPGVARGVHPVELCEPGRRRVPGLFGKYLAGTLQCARDETGTDLLTIHPEAQPRAGREGQGETDDGQVAVLMVAAVPGEFDHLIAVEIDHAEEDDVVVGRVVDGDCRSTTPAPSASMMWPASSEKIAAWFPYVYLRLSP